MAVCAASMPDSAMRPPARHQAAQQRSQYGQRIGEYVGNHDIGPMIDVVARMQQIQRRGVALRVVAGGVERVRIDVGAGHPGGAQLRSGQRQYTRAASVVDGFAAGYLGIEPLEAEPSG